jgi:SAM-dependent methyltransferase
MYSECKDFEEKLNVFNNMRNVINSFCGNDKISLSELALEIGGSGGLLAGIVSNSGPRVICTDIVDTQVKYNGEFSRLIKEKFERNGQKFDLGKIEFHKADAQNLIYANEKFDFVYSLNAFEHIPDPLIAIAEVARVLRKGGVFFASFDPVWTADSGSHFIEYVQEPWLHLLLNHNDYRKKMQAGGAEKWQMDEYPVAMNMKQAYFYENDFKNKIDELFSKSMVTEWRGCINAEDVEHPNRYAAARQIGCDPDELLIRGFQFVAVK